MNEHEQEFQDLIEQLRAERPPAPEPEHAFTTTLRGRLLGQYERKDGWDIGRLTNTATAIAVLALVIFAGWYLSSSQQPATINSSDIQITRPAETAEATNQLEAIHSTLHVSRVVDELDESYTWNATVEHWQTAGGRLHRTLVTDENGQIDHFAQSDGSRLWLGNSLNPIYSPHRRLRSYFTFYSTASERIELNPPFYSDLGWDGLAALMVSLELDCSTYECVEQIVEPALVDEALQLSRAYGWATSLIGTVEENGRTFRVFHINYNHNMSPEVLPQYRQVKIDANTFELVSIRDYDGEKLLRSIELVSQETVNLRLVDFQMIPEVVERTSLDGAIEQVQFGEGIQLGGYGLSALPPSFQPEPLALSLYWHADNMPEGEFTGFVHILSEDGKLVAQHDAVLRWQPYPGGRGKVEAHFTFETKLDNGRYQIQVGVYNSATGQRLTTTEGITGVQIDEFVIEN
jgi:hypothetical protein